MIADVQRELAEKVVEVFVSVLIASRQSAVADLNVTPRQWGEEAARQLTPLIADAEKRAAARALEEMAHALDTPAYWPAAKLIRNRAGHIRAALDPSGAAEGTGR